MVTSDGKPEYETSTGRLDKKIEHATLVAKSMADFELFVDNTIKVPMKSQEPYRVLCRVIDGETWMHAPNPLLKGERVGVHCNGHDVNVLAKKFGHKVKVVFA